MHPKKQSALQPADSAHIQRVTRGLKGIIYVHRMWWVEGPANDN